MQQLGHAAAAFASVQPVSGGTVELKNLWKKAVQIHGVWLKPLGSSEDAMCAWAKCHARLLLAPRNAWLTRSTLHFLDLSMSTCAPHSNVAESPPFLH